MRPPKVIKFREFQKLLRRYDIKLLPGRRHNLFVSPEGIKYPVPFSKPGEDVERAYVNAARRAFSLTPEDGVSDREFYQRK